MWAVVLNTNHQLAGLSIPKVVCPAALSTVKIALWPLLIPGQKKWLPNFRLLLPLSKYPNMWLYYHKTPWFFQTWVYAYRRHVQSNNPSSSNCVFQSLFAKHNTAEPRFFGGYFAGAEAKMNSSAVCWSFYFEGYYFSDKLQHCHSHWRSNAIQNKSCRK